MRKSEPLSVEVASEGRALLATACRAGRDLVVTITGGEAPHVGCVVLARPHPAHDDPERRTVTSSVVSIPPHREEAVARPVAERLATALGGTVVVAAGIHTDGLTPEGIAAYLELGRRLAEELLSALRG